MTRKYKKIVNERLSKHLSNQEGLNFCHLFTPKRNGNISFIGNYRNDIEYITLDENLNVVDFVDNDRRGFYGVSVKIDSYIITQALVNQRFKDPQGLEDFIKEYHDCFTLHKNQGEKYLKVFSKLCTLSLASIFGVKIKINDEMKEELKNNFDKQGLFEIKDDINILIIRGCPTEELFNYLNKYKYIKNQKNNEWIFDTNNDQNSLSFKDIWSNRTNIILTSGNVFYSGALLKVISINENDEPLYGNDNIASAHIEFEESSYGTVFTLDNNFSIHALLSEEEKKLIREMYKYDDDKKRELLNALSNNEDKELDILNKYLKECINVNQLGITGNIISSDNNLLVTIRNANSIDANQFYPSVNGNCEIINDDVEFYKRSANEDFPTIDINDKRIDFYDELCREAYAELSLSLEDNNWYCYGITLAGNIDEDDVDYTVAQKRRLHFNIICEQTVDKKFVDIVENQKYSTEAFENAEIKGIRLLYYKNIFDFLLRGVIYNVANIISNNIPSVLSLIALIALYQAKEYGLDTIVGTASIITAFFALYAFLKNISKYYKNYINLFVIGNKNLVKRAYNKFHNRRTHPVCFAAIMCYFANLMENK